MILYLDTSSLIKLYVEEDSSSEVRSLVARAEVVATSVLAYAETRSALARLERGGFLDSDLHGKLRGVLEAEWVRFLRLPVTEMLCRNAGDLAQEHGLRGFDSVHLASFLQLRELNTRTSTELSAFDAPLTQAATAEVERRRSTP